MSIEETISISRKTIIIITRTDSNELTVYTKEGKFAEFIIHLPDNKLVNSVKI